MRKLLFTALLSLVSIGIFAQSQKYSNGLTFKKLFIDYFSQNEEGSISAFKDYKHGFEFGVSRKFTNNLTLYVPGKFGIVKDSIDGTYKTLMGIEGDLQYHFYSNSGNINPYIFAGFGAMKVYNGNLDKVVPLGLGLNFKVTDRLYFNVQTEYRLSLDEKKNNLHHGIGFVYMIGKEKKEVKTLTGVIDSDGDGVEDAMDLCPQVRGLAELNGCPDSDGDGVPDYRDACPDAKGVKELKGCPDSDGDGVADLDDECPNVAGSKFNKGCPDESQLADRDNDGVVDSKDKCPDIAGTVGAMGCPDRDGDGVADDVDKCPSQAGSAETEGCPDSDKDGTPDNKDKCPNSFGPKVYNGCPDSDGDGLDDFNDRCPNMAGPVENKGCPEISAKDKETLNIAMRAVEFDIAKSSLKPISYQILNQIVEILNRYPDYNVVISGHTDNTGSSSKNQLLSEQRAKACYDYLRSQGISTFRMSYVGYGESRPISSNDTVQGRALNRRVEFELVPTK